MIGEPLICCASGVPHAQITQKQREKITSGGINKTLRVEKIVKSALQTGSPPKACWWRSPAKLQVQTPAVFSRSHLAVGSDSIKARTHAAVWNAINAHTNAHLLLLLCVLSCLSFYLCSHTQLCENWAEQRSGERLTVPMKESDEGAAVKYTRR